MEESDYLLETDILMKEDRLYFIFLDIAHISQSVEVEKNEIEVNYAIESLR